jgi:hypothetical protein
MPRATVFGWSGQRRAPARGLLGKAVTLDDSDYRTRRTADGRRAVHDRAPGRVQSCRGRSSPGASETAASDRGRTNVERSKAVAVFSCEGRCCVEQVVRLVVVEERDDGPCQAERSEDVIDGAVDRPAAQQDYEIGPGCDGQATARPVVYWQRARQPSPADRAHR